MLRHLLLGLSLAVFASSAPSLAAVGVASGFKFKSIDGGEIALSDYAGKPVLVVNTASRCGFTPQYDDLQTLYDRYSARGLTVIGVSSNSFRQELSSADAVKEFCEVNFSITFPMTEITPVTGANAHPFYVWARDQGVTPNWNFNKILIDGSGHLTASFGSTTPPLATPMIEAIEAALAN